VKATEQLSEVFAGKSLIISGTFRNFSREEIKATIEKHGGKNVTSISKNTDFFVTGDNIGPAKLEKAIKLGVKMISEDEFMEMIHTYRDSGLF